MHEGEQVSLDSVLSKVRKLVALAEHPNTDPTEAATYREMADALMLKYAISEAMAESARPAEQRTKPVIITVEVGGSTEIIGYFGSLCDTVARHCRCRVRLYSAWRDRAWQAKVYGFESDVRYFEMLYTTIRLHMLGVLIPRVDKAQTLEENCYRLHNAGYNWLQIAELYGWRKGQQADYPDIKIPYYNQQTDDVQPSTKVGSHFKRAYIRAARAHGDAGVGIQIAAGGTETYRRSAAQGYVSRIAQRLRDTAGKREAGAEVVLASRFGDLDDLFRADNPDLFREDEEPAEDSGRKRRAKKYTPPPFNEQAYTVGVQHANTADLSTGVGTAASRALR